MSPRVIACLSWYDEPTGWLAECVTAAARACDHVVAVDGAYMLYPGARASSEIEQGAAIRDAARASGIGCTLYESSSVWAAEADKRAYMLALAETIAEPNVDWYFRLDADEFITHVGDDFRRQLAETTCDVGEVALYNKGNDWGPAHRFLYRAIPGLRVKHRHQAYVTPDGRDLSALDADRRELEPAVALDCRVEHRTFQRDRERRRDKAVFYNRVARLNAEGQDSEREQLSRDRSQDMGADWVFAGLADDDESG